jgi:hypothetical protein
LYKCDILLELIFVTRAYCFEDECC